MFDDDPARQLGPLSQDILRALIDATEEGEGLTIDEAVAVLRQANEAHEDRLWTEEPDRFRAEVEYLLDELENKGFLYEAQDGLRVTDHDVLE